MSEESKRQWMVWYRDDQLDPVGVLASDRSTAATVGKKARGNEPVAAVIEEDEGAADDLADLADEDLSTLTHPQRFMQTINEGNAPA